MILIKSQFLGIYWFTNIGYLTSNKSMFFVIQVALFIPTWSILSYKSFLSNVNHHNYKLIVITGMILLGPVQSGASLVINCPARGEGVTEVISLIIDGRIRYRRIWLWENVCTSWKIPLLESAVLIWARYVLPHKLWG